MKKNTKDNSSSKAQDLSSIIGEDPGKKVKKKFVFYPFFSSFFLLFWLSLNGWSWADFIFGLCLTLGANYLLQYLEVKRIYLRKKYLFIKLFAYILRDTILSHLALIALVLQIKKKKINQESKFLTLSLQLYDQNALALLSCLVSLSPGALWLSYNASSHSVLIHLLNGEVEEEFVLTFENIYQKLLGEIFIEEERKARSLRKDLLLSPDLLKRRQ